MREVIATGKSVEEATENGCRELGLSRDEVSVEILEMPARRLFKTTPAKVKITADEPQAPAVEPVAAPAQPAATEKKVEKPAEKPVEKNHKKEPQKRNPAPKAVLPAEPEVEIDLAQNAPAARAAAYLNEIFTAMGATGFTVKAFRQGDATLLRIEGDNLQEVIETRGDTVQALSYLTDRAVNKGVDKRDKDYLRIRLDIAGYRGRRENELISLATRTGNEVQRTKRSKTLAPMNPYERLIVHTAISGMEGLVSESIGSDSERRVVIKSTAPDATEGEDWKAPRRGNGGGNNRGGNGRGPRPPRRDGRDGRDSGRRGNDRGDRRPGGPGGRPTSTPEREYANKTPDPDATPVVPKRREAISDGEDLPLYGKIEL